nr:acyltransferase [Microbacterium lemovicicum]
MAKGRSFAEVFDPRANGLNFVRLSLAVLVILYHSFPLTGTPIPFDPVKRLIGQVWVDGFFAISGYLIVSSWVNRPMVWPFLRARLLRIYPAFWVCLLFTALLVVPAVTGVFGSENFRYILANATLFITQYDIAGTPDGVPYPGAWNGSLWTLFWEFLCYLGVLALGVLRLFRWRWTIPLAFGIALAASVAATLGLTSNGWIVNGSRFGLMFLAGAMLWRFRNVLPVGAGWILGSVAAIALSTLLTNYRLLGALPVAYVVLVLGALLTSPRLRFKNDISYGVYIYAFLVQQVLATWGLWQWGWFAFFLIATVATVPLATLSWFLVERPALKLKGKRAPADPAVVASVP